MMMMMVKITIIIVMTSNDQRLGSAFHAVTVISSMVSLADFHLLSLAKINIFSLFLTFYRHI